MVNEHHTRSRAETVRCIFWLYGHALAPLLFDDEELRQESSGATFQQLTEATSLQACALQLLGL
jgi:hypothetical protein